ncbi:GspE/PulE family protein [Thermosulfurimonas dismutans]|uniref:Type IV fimbrial assembly, ATPase PilB n=1 Tax=Thermosulfurimonas dismutans TaxID=999894 RepID=A0A179D1G7_9BACT|nr:Type IV fimbrial assembly, ATPase PilB [Thermosulfurimonas dismutans]
MPVARKKLTPWSSSYFQKRRVILEWDGEEPCLYFTEQTPKDSIEEVRFLLQRPFKKRKISLEEFSEKLERLLSELKEISLSEEGEEGEKKGSLDLLNVYSEAPVVNLINRVLIKASRVGASDIHFDPGEKEALIKLRLDGVLHEYQRFPMRIYSQVVARIKVMSNLNVAEKLVPQDGRMRIKIGERELDIRVSVLPTIFGERVVLRLLDKSNRLLMLEELGLSEEDYHKIVRLAKKPYGLILATGPTGAGKSTTLYAMLLLVRELYPHKNIITIEDPVEYQVSGLGQVQVNPKVGLTFAAGLRSILRQDPDVILVGEIRDNETAEISIHAALTGHLVLSTLHTNDAPTAITRLVDMGIEPYLIASSFEGVIAQRLVRRICPHCREPYRPSLEELKALGLPENFDGELYRGRGCDECLGTGYKGRIGIFEVLELDEKLKNLILTTPNANEIRNEALKGKFKILRQDALEKVLAGLTTSSELLALTDKE